MQDHKATPISRLFRLQRIQGATAIPLTDDRRTCASIIQIGDRFPGAVLPETLRRTLYMPLNDGKPLLDGMPAGPVYGSRQSTFCRRLAGAVSATRSKDDYTLHSLCSERPMTLERSRSACFYLVFMEGIRPAIGSIHYLSALTPGAWLYKPHHPKFARFMHPVPGLSRDMIGSTLDKLLKSMDKPCLI